MADFNQLCQSIVNKSVDQITTTDVNHFVELHFEIEAKRGEVSDFNDLDKWVQKLMNNGLMSKEIYNTMEAVFIKVREREKMAKSKSTIESSKQRHVHNLNLLSSVWLAFFTIGLKVK